MNPSAVAACVAIALGAHGAVAAAAETALDARRVEQLTPGVKVRNIAPVRIDGGLYEVLDDQGNIFYMDGGGTIGFQAQLIDVATGRNLTQESLARLKSVDFEALPLDLAIKRVKGDGRRRIAVFADPDCPFCASLEQTLAGVDDVTVYTFLYPIDELHPEATDRATRIWCAADRDAAWLGWLLEKREPPAAAGCEAPVARIVEIAPNFWASGTPSLVFGSGRTTAGALPRENLEMLLDESKLQRDSASASTIESAAHR